jgi:hypothetical protein
MFGRGPDEIIENHLYLGGFVLIWSPVYSSLFLQLTSVMSVLLRLSTQI